MAVEIRELIVKATIADGSGQAHGGPVSAADKAQIIKECVREVLKVIEKSKTR